MVNVSVGFVRLKRGRYTVTWRDGSGVIVCVRLHLWKVRAGQSDGRAIIQSINGIARSALKIVSVFEYLTDIHGICVYSTYTGTVYGTRVIVLVMACLSVSCVALSFWVFFVRLGTSVPVWVRLGTFVPGSFDPSHP